MNAPLTLVPPPDITLNEAQRKAIADAMDGDWEAADALELSYLNNPKNGVCPHGSQDWPAGRAEELRERGSRHRLKAVALHRAWGPACQLAVEWHVDLPCDDCLGKGTLDVNGAKTLWIDCPSCDGVGTDDLMEPEVTYTDIDGRVLAFEPATPFSETLKNINAY